MRYPRGYWTQERVIELLQTRAAKGLTMEDTAREDPRLYTGASSAFGSFKEAVAAAGYEYNVQKRVFLNMDREELLGFLKTMLDQDALGVILIDSVYLGAFNRRFGHRLRGALESLEIEPPEVLDRSFTEEEIGKFLKDWYRLEDQPIDVERLTQKARHAIARCFETLENAADALDVAFDGDNSMLPEVKPRGRTAQKNRPAQQPVEPETVSPDQQTRFPRGYWTEERVIAQIQEWADADYDFSLRKPYDRKLHNAAQEKFGSFEKGLQAAGVQDRWDPMAGKRRSRPGDNDEPAQAVPPRYRFSQSDFAEYLRQKAEDGRVDLRKEPPRIQRAVVSLFGSFEDATTQTNVTLIDRKGTVYESPTQRKYDLLARKGDAGEVLDASELRTFLKLTAINGIVNLRMAPGWLPDQIETHFDSLAQAAEELELTIVDGEGNVHAAAPVPVG